MTRTFLDCEWVGCECKTPVDDGRLKHGGSDVDALTTYENYFLCEKHWTEHARMRKAIDDKCKHPRP